MLCIIQISKRGTRKQMDPTKCCSLFLVRLQYNIDEWFPRYCCSLGSRSVVEEEAAVWGKWLEGGWGLRLRLLSDFFQSARLSGASSSTERVAKLNVIPARPPSCPRGWLQTASWSASPAPCYSCLTAMPMEAPLYPSSLSRLGCFLAKLSPAHSIVAGNGI